MKKITSAIDRIERATLALSCAMALYLAAALKDIIFLRVPKSGYPDFIRLSYHRIQQHLSV